MHVMEPSLISHKAPSPTVVEPSSDLPTENLLASQGQNRPKVCLGMPLYNNTEFLPAALNSILAQTYRHFQLVVVDDSSIAEPGEIIKEFASLDERIRYVKNPTRKGLVDNWKRCFELAENADYFAWVSDHDLWHPEFLASMVEVLQSHPSVVLSYPLTGHIAADGQIRKKKLVPPPLSTLGMPEAQRVVTICRDTRYFGKMVYGLFRASALRSAGVFRRVLFPDVILLFELCLTGDFVQVDQELRSQREVAKFSIARQRRSLFVKKPWYIFLPWPFVNACVLFWQTVVVSSPGQTHHRVQGIKMSLIYLRRYLAVFGEGTWVGSYKELIKGKSPWILKIRETLKI